MCISLHSRRMGELWRFAEGSCAEGDSGAGAAEGDSREDKVQHRLEEIEKQKEAILSGALRCEARPWLPSVADTSQLHQAPPPSCARGRSSC